LEVTRNLFNLDGRVALVTGGSRGIGRAISLGLATFGADVAILGLSPKTEEVIDEIRRLGRRGLFVKGNVADVADSRRAVGQIAADLGKIDILVNNAGVGPTHPAAEVTPEEWDEVMGVNIRGLFFITQAVGKQMIKRGQGGRVINIGSIFGIVGSEIGASVYHAAKGSIVVLTRALACEWAKSGILVNSIGPGFITTDLTKELQTTPVLGDLIKNRHALGRFGRPEEIVGAVVLMAGDGATFITGQNLYVDGGYTAW
jgi:2-deoxy-D-gluconate 3-dehydrogenase